jgi:hypothetical protein
VILHVIPEHVFISEFQGSFKDVTGRIELLSSMPHGYRSLRVGADDPQVLQEVRAEGRPTHILIEYSSFPRIARYLRREYPGAFLAVRAINIEPLQNLDNQGLLPVRAMPRTLYGCLRLAWTDWVVARQADKVYAISPFEARHYWRWLARPGRTVWLPYLPRMARSLTDGSEEKAIVACMPGAQEHRRTIDVVLSFGEFARTALGLGSNLEYVVTGDLGRWRTPIPGQLRQVGHVEDLNGFLRRVAAVAILSPLGRGFKTTIADAVASGAYVLLHPRQYSRCPEILQRYCVAVWPHDARSVAEALARIGEPFPDTRPVDGLSTIARTTLIADFS